MCAAGTVAVGGEIADLNCLPGGQIIRLGNGVAYNFPSEENTSFTQCACFRMPKHNEVFRLERNNEVVAVASDRNLSLKWTIDDARLCQHPTTPLLTSCFPTSRIRRTSDRLTQDVAFRAGVTKRQQKPQPACAPDGAKLLDAVLVGALIFGYSDRHDPPPHAVTQRRPWIYFLALGG
jgi:hypothetical protein